MRFDGGPAMVNLGDVERVIGLSIGYTLMLPWRFERFASKLERIKGQSVDRKQIRGDLELALQKIKNQKAAADRLMTGQGVADLDEGFGRLDALNRIGNQVFYTSLLDPATGELRDQLLKGNFARHDAPVSFPPIWDTPYFLWAQYDASVLNELVRNSGEALGVSATINMTAAAPGRPLFASSIHLSEIARFEELLRGADPFSAGDASRGKFTGLVAPNGRTRRRNSAVTRPGRLMKSSSNKVAIFIALTALNVTGARSTTLPWTKSGRKIRSGAQRTPIAQPRMRRIGWRSADGIISTWSRCRSQRSAPTPNNPASSRRGAFTYPRHSD
ncbi:MULTISPECIES: hypothetical protein [unclassified Bradyrhizobium]|uniref:hypothetical protein n=1 Tax=unclassified Bradyrhizobium TaxID=2631580 RepID=UPI003209DAE6